MNKRVVKNEFYYPSKDGTTQIHAIEWIPDGKVAAVLQICAMAWWSILTVTMNLHDF